MEPVSRRRVQIVLLCEDDQHEAFARRFLERSGWNRRDIRVEKSPGGRGSAEQWVRRAYSKEVQKFRAAPHVARALIVIVDEDKLGGGVREEQFAAALAGERLAARSEAEAILHIIPARNIETWLAYLDGTTVDETTAYPRLQRERLCAPMVLALKQMCDRRELREPAPPSLARACVELRERLP